MATEAKQSELSEDAPSEVQDLQDRGPHDAPARSHAQLGVEGEESLESSTDGPGDPERSIRDSVPAPDQAWRAHRLQEILESGDGGEQGRGPGRPGAIDAQASTDPPPPRSLLAHPAAPWLAALVLVAVLAVWLLRG